MLLSSTSQIFQFSQAVECAHFSIDKKFKQTSIALDSTVIMFTQIVPYFAED